MNLQSKILITGANGLVGQALISILKRLGYENVFGVERTKCDLTDFNAVKKLFLKEKPDFVFHLAAAVYGIGGNLKNKGRIFLDNVLINTHVIEAAHLSGVKKIVAMGTVAAYPDLKLEPVTENLIWQGPPHASENSYGHAKRAMLAQLLAYQENYNLDFAYVISTNLYGPYDKFDIQYGHVIPSLIRKFYEAKKNNTTVTVWGDGSAARDFMYSKDMAKALVTIMQKKITGPINVATGLKTQIKEVVDILACYLNMQKQIKWDATMPNGRKYYTLDLTQLHSTKFITDYSVKSGLIETYNWFSDNYVRNLTRQ